MNAYVKDPAARLDYAVDWSAWLGEDTIASVVWAVPTGLVLATQAHTDTVATVWLSGGAVNAVYRVVCHVVTAGGREDERSLLIRVRER